MQAVQSNSIVSMSESSIQDLPFSEPNLTEVIQSVARKGLFLDMCEDRVKGTKCPKTAVEKVLYPKLKREWDNLKKAEERYRRALMFLRPGPKASPSRYGEIVDRVRDEEIRMRERILSIFQSHIQFFKEKGIGIVYSIEKQGYQITGSWVEYQDEVNIIRSKVNDEKYNSNSKLSIDVILCIFSKELDKI
jgi:hypothetical protein